MGALRLTYKENYRPLKVMRGNFYLQKNSDAERYEFGFNGQLKDNEIYGEGNAYDFGEREYDPRSIRLLSQDPLSESFPYYSPYQFAGNSFIQFIDLDGAEPAIPLFEKFKYGDNIALNTVKTIPNAATGIVNGGIRLINTGLYNAYMINDLGVKSYSKAVVNYWKNEEIPGFQNLVKKPIKYFSETSMKQIGVDLSKTVSSPKFLEGVIAFGGSLYLGGYRVGSGSNIPITKGTSPKVVNPENPVPSPNVQKVLNTIDDFKSQGGNIKPNPLAPNQEINLTFQQGTRKIDLRIETHPLPKKYGGDGITPQRHLNIDLYPNKKVLPNDGHKILE